MSNANQHYPYKLLGIQLRRMRERRLESLAEVSGAVEIDSTSLIDFENGLKRPSEDILVLLISHFETKDSEAAELWEMAGYSKIEPPIISLSSEDISLNKPIIMMMPMDGRILYSDLAHVKVNNFGVTMNFMQSTGSSDQPLAIARIGMSKEHASTVLDTLKQALERAEKPTVQKLLPRPRAKSKNKDQKQTTDQ